MHPALAVAILAACLLVCARTEAQPSSSSEAYCDGGDDDADGDIDEGCDCRDQFVREYPEISVGRLTGIFSLNGPVLVAGERGLVLRAEDGTLRTLPAPARGGRVRGAFVANGEIVLVHADGSLNAIGVRPRRIGRVARVADSDSFLGANLESALVFGRDGISRLFPRRSRLPGTPRRWMTAVAGDANGLVYAVDWEIVHRDGDVERTSRLPTGRPDAFVRRSANAIYALSHLRDIWFFDGTAWTRQMHIDGDIVSSSLSMVDTAAGPIVVERPTQFRGPFTLYRSTGTTWTRTVAPFDDASVAIVAQGETLLVAAGENLHALRDGTFRRELGSFLPYAIASNGARSVYVVGWGGLVLRYDGRRWRALHDRLGIALRDVVVLHDDLAVVVGERLGGGGRGATGVVLRCDADRCVNAFGDAQGIVPLSAVWGSDIANLVFGTPTGELVHHVNGAFPRTRVANARISAIAGGSRSNLYVALQSEQRGDSRWRGGLAHFDGTASTQLVTPVLHELFDLLALGPDRLVAGGGNFDYAETGATLFTYENGSAHEVAVDGYDGLVGLAAVERGYLSLGRTRVEGDAGEWYGEAAWVLRHHEGDRTAVVARDTGEIGAGVTATSSRNVFVITDTAILHRCGPTSLLP